MSNRMQKDSELRSISSTLSRAWRAGSVLQAGLAMCGLLAAAGSAWAQQTQATPAPAVKSTIEKLQRTQTVVIGYREASVPLSYADATGKPIGLAVEMCQRVVDALRRELRLPNLRIAYRLVTSANRIELVESGEVDLECGSTTNNAARRERVAFSIAHYFATGRFLVKRGSGIRDLGDLRTKTVVSTRGTTHLNFLKQALERGVLAGRVLEGKDHNDSFAMVARGEADAFMMDDIVLYALRATSGNPEQYEVVGIARSAEPLAIMMRKDPEFKRLVDRAVANLFLDGAYAALYERWFRSPIPPNGINLDIPMSQLLREQMRFPSDKVGDESTK